MKNFTVTKEGISAWFIHRQTFCGEEVARYLVDNGIVESLDGNLMYVGPDNVKLVSYCADGAQGDRLCVEEFDRFGTYVNLYEYRYGDAPPDLWCRTVHAKHAPPLDISKQAGTSLSQIEKLMIKRD